MKNIRQCLLLFLFATSSLAIRIENGTDSHLILEMADHSVITISHENGLDISDATMDQFELTYIGPAGVYKINLKDPYDTRTIFYSTNDEKEIMFKIQLDSKSSRVHTDFAKYSHMFIRDADPSKDNFDGYIAVLTKKPSTESEDRVNSALDVKCTLF